MLSTTAAAIAFIGLASCSLIAAAPTWPGDWSQDSDGSVSKTSSPPPYTWDTTFPTEVSPDGNKFRYPLSNSFPTPNPAQLSDINKAAGGTLSNNKPPPSISSDGITNLELVAFNELFEVAFFTDLLKNVTEGVSGYEVPEEHCKSRAHLPCEYVFPVTNLPDAILLAQTFTDVVLGTLQDVITVFANANDDGFVRGVAASLGNEGEQNGFYRLLQGKRPSAQPFLTASARSFAFSALNQKFVVEGSCPDIESGRISLDIFDILTLEDEVVEPRDQMLTFSFDGSTLKGNSTSSEQETGKADEYSTDDLKFVLINGQNKPIVNDLDNVMIQDGRVTFQAPFLFEKDLLFGLTIAVVAKGEDLSTVNAVEKATLFGPALIEVL